VQRGGHEGRLKSLVGQGREVGDVTHAAADDELGLGKRAAQLAGEQARRGRRVAVLALSARRPLLEGLEWIAAPRDAAGYAHALYASLRRLDDSGCETIIVEQPPQGAEWAAINDRLARAAAGSSGPDAT